MTMKARIRHQDKEELPYVFLVMLQNTLEKQQLGIMTHIFLLCSKPAQVKTLMLYNHCSVVYNGSYVRLGLVVGIRHRWIGGTKGGLWKTASGSIEPSTEQGLRVVYDPDVFQGGFCLFMKATKKENLIKFLEGNKDFISRGDVVEIETWWQADGKVGTRRNWILKDLANVEVIGRTTRFHRSTELVDFVASRTMGATSIRSRRSTSVVSVVARYASLHPRPLDPLPFYDDNED